MSRTGVHFLRPEEGTSVSSTPSQTPRQMAPLESSAAVSTPTADGQHHHSQHPSQSQGQIQLEKRAVLLSWIGEAFCALRVELICGQA